MSDCMHVMLLQVQRTSSATIQQLRQEADDARQQLSTVRQLADKQIAKAQAAAQQEVDLYRQRWRDEYERRRKLHNQVSCSNRPAAANCIQTFPSGRCFVAACRSLAGRETPCIMQVDTAQSACTATGIY